MAITTTACDDSKGHGERAQRNNDGRCGAIMTVHGATTTTMPNGMPLNGTLQG